MFEHSNTVNEHSNGWVKTYKYGWTWIDEWTLIVSNIVIG